MFLSSYTKINKIMSQQMISNNFLTYNNDNTNISFSPYLLFEPTISVSLCDRTFWQKSFFVALHARQSVSHLDFKTLYTWKRNLERFAQL